MPSRILVHSYCQLASLGGEWFAKIDFESAVLFYLHRWCVLLVARSKALCSTGLPTVLAGDAVPLFNLDRFVFDEF